MQGVNSSNPSTSLTGIPSGGLPPTQTTTIPSSSAGAECGATTTTPSTHRITTNSISSGSYAGGTTRDCPLCLQEVSSDLFPTLLSCAHSACLPCLKQYLAVVITESRVNITCPQCQDLMHPTGKVLLFFMQLIIIEYF